MSRRQIFIINGEFIDVEVQRLKNGKYMGTAISWESERSYMYISKDIRKAVNASVEALLRANSDQM
ncbi:hypothetical protein [Peribacillus sp. SCS-155]|uniref:hypothetical protein n=1 Tax=Peribacillus sedimenti TaxID=3115297 RepID=UPI0039063092